MNERGILDKAYAALLQAARDAETAEAYYAVQKVLAAHSYCVRAQAQAMELDRYWAEEHPISMAIGNDVYEGAEAVKAYYVDANAQMREGKLNIMSALFPDEIANDPSNLGIGDLQLELLTTPYVALSEDLQTAKGVFWVLAISSEINLAGSEKSCVVVEKQAADFVREHGVWKIQRLRCYPECQSDLRDDYFKHVAFGGPKEGPDAEKPNMGRAVANAFPKSNLIVHPMPDNGPAHNAKRVAIFSPEIPEPFVSWDEDRSLARPWDNPPQSILDHLKEMGL